MDLLFHCFLSVCLLSSLVNGETVEANLTQCVMDANCSSCLSLGCYFWICSENSTVCSNETNSTCSGAQVIASTECKQNETTSDPVTSSTDTSTTVSARDQTTQSATTPAPGMEVVTRVANNTEQPRKESQVGRGFHGPSFAGGIILALGLMAISLITFKYYKARTERNYLTL